jgi:hypothetical protein
MSTLPPLAKEPVPMPSSPTDELAMLWNSNWADREKALRIAEESGAQFDRKHTPFRCPICQRITPCPVHPETNNG